MSTNPSTPLSNRRCINYHDHTRIPQPSPNQMRRSLSLRLRNNTDTGGTINVGTISPSPINAESSPSESLVSLSSNRKNSIETTLKTSRSFSLTVSNMTHYCGNAKKDGPAGGATEPQQPNNDKNSPTTTAAVQVPVVIPKKSNCLVDDNSRENDLFLNTTKLSPRALSLPHRNCRHSINTPTKYSAVSPTNGYLDDDLDSLYSYQSIASGRSVSLMSSCDHSFVPQNGTTFSGRNMKYVVHCSSYAGQTGEDYLTPTQRAQKHIRRLKELLTQARINLEQKDSEILRLTKEVVELRLFKASLNSPEERSNSSDAVTVRENNDMKTSQDVSPIADMTDQGLKLSSRHDLCAPLNSCNSEMLSSFSDSGHFEEISTSSINSKDSYVQTHDKACGSDFYDQQRQDLIKMYEAKIEELIKVHDAEQQQQKITNTDRIEGLLQKLAECNSRYADLVPDYEQARERIRELEKQLEDLQHKLQEHEDKQNKLYLHMYQKGQEAERINHADKVLEFAHQATNRVSVPELLQQLQVTQNELENIKDTNYVQESGGSAVLLSAKEAVSLWLLGARKTMYRRLIEAQQKNKVDPEVTLQFLKSAVYYFLTDKENTQGHLNAIESILGFSDIERQNIDRARTGK